MEYIILSLARSSLVDGSIFGGISLVGGVKDLDQLHKCHVDKYIGNGLDLIKGGSLLDKLGILGNNGGVGEEINGGHFVCLLLFFR